MTKKKKKKRVVEHAARKMQFHGQRFAVAKRDEAR